MSTRRKASKGAKAKPKVMLQPGWRDLSTHLYEHYQHTSGVYVQRSLHPQDKVGEFHFGWWVRGKPVLALDENALWHVKTPELAMCKALRLAEAQVAKLAKRLGGSFKSAAAIAEETHHFHHP